MRPADAESISVTTTAPRAADATLGRHRHTTRARPRRVPGWLLAVPFAGLAFLLLARSWQHFGSVLPGLPGDNETFVWGLQWFATSITHGHDPFVTTYVHAPAGINVFWNAWMPPAAVLLIPVTLVLGPMASYTVLLTLAFTVSGLTAWRAATRFVAPPTAYTVGLLYEVCPFMLAHGLDHPMLVLAFFPPLVLLLGADFLTGRRSAGRTGVYLGLATALQVWLDEEMATDVALVALVAVVAVAVVGRRELRRWVAPTLRLAAIAATLVVVGTAPALAVQFLGPDRISGSFRALDLVPVIDVTNFAYATRVNVVGRLYPDPGQVLDQLESTAFLGLLPIAAIAAIAALRRRRSVQVLGAVALSTGLLTLGRTVTVNDVQGWTLTPWRLVSALPLLGDLEPVRLSLEVFLLVAILAGVGIEELLVRRRAAGRSALPVALLALACVASLAPVLPMTTTRVAVPAFFTSGADAVPAGSLVAVYPDAYSSANDDAMVWQAAAKFRFRMLGGYVLGPLLPGQADQFARQPLPILTWLGDRDLAQPSAGGTPVPTAAAARANLVSLGVRAVVIAYPQEHAALVAAVTDMLGTPPVRTGDVALWSLRRPA